ncbi:hypothetical protein N7539_006227 [Penicillium diatomitis]|uniref:Uncharacterized protein n=1 Tax=Penicillium diatomitis TaxID=2819901 RepID=A0A9W9X2Y8_9EURO|nr:uncharacterized protein N7539_006227 [Penicillium diatomitis]KAJ5482781.1 hypothetical protein N7539_006227 [Penicillium diatomitis]
MHCEAATGLSLGIEFAYCSLRGVRQDNRMGPGSVQLGTPSAGHVPEDMMYSFSNARIGLMVGIGG